jgi:hypothetical protein
MRADKAQKVKKVAESLLKNPLQTQREVAEET